MSRKSILDKPLPHVDDINVVESNTLRLVLREDEAIDIEGPITIIANRKSDLVFKGPGKIGRRYIPGKDKRIKILALPPRHIINRDFVEIGQIGKIIEEKSKGLFLAEMDNGIQIYLGSEHFEFIGQL